MVLEQKEVFIGNGSEIKLYFAMQCGPKYEKQTTSINQQAFCIVELVPQILGNMWFTCGLKAVTPPIQISSMISYLLFIFLMLLTGTGLAKNKIHRACCKNGCEKKTKMQLRRVSSKMETMYKGLLKN